MFTQPHLFIAHLKYLFKMWLTKNYIYFLKVILKEEPCFGLEQQIQNKIPAS